MYVLIHASAESPIQDVDFTVYGPFATMGVAAHSAERLREASGLPVEANPDNNELWTEAGHWFGIVPLLSLDTEVARLLRVPA